MERRQLQRENVLLKRALQTAHQFSNIIGTQRADAGGLPADRDDRADQQHGARSPASRAPARSSSRAPSTSTRRAKTGRSSRSTAARCPRRCSTRSCSATCAARSRARTRNKKGLIEVADKGTIFLDEIGEMSPLVQVKLLRVLQERRFRRLGGTEEVEADIRIIAATNRDLSKMVADGRVPRGPLLPDQRHPACVCPPLRERGRGHPAARRALRGAVRRADGEGDHRHLRRRAGLPAGLPWPGNIRELENAIERAVALERTPTILVESLPEQVRDTAAASAAGERRSRGRFPGRRDSTSSSTSSTSSASTSPKRCGGPAASRSRPPSCLGMSFRSFRYYMKKYNLK